MLLYATYAEAADGPCTRSYGKRQAQKDDPNGRAYKRQRTGASKDAAEDSEEAAPRQRVYKKLKLEPRPRVVADGGKYVKQFSALIQFFRRYADTHEKLNSLIEKVEAFAERITSDQEFALVQQLLHIAVGASLMATELAMPDDLFCSCKPGSDSSDSSDSDDSEDSEPEVSPAPVAGPDSVQVVAGQPE